MKKARCQKASRFSFAPCAPECAGVCQRVEKRRLRVAVRKDALLRRASGAGGNVKVIRPGEEIQGRACLLVFFTTFDYMVIDSIHLVIYGYYNSRFSGLLFMCSMCKSVRAMQTGDHRPHTAPSTHMISSEPSAPDTSPASRQNMRWHDCPLDSWLQPF